MLVGGDAVKLALAVLLALLTAAPAHAARWQQKRISVVDYTPGWPIAEAARRWSDVTVLSLQTSAASAPYPNGCPPAEGAVAVCLGDFGASYGLSSTAYVSGRRGNIVAARIIINTYGGRDFTDFEKRYLIVHELGHAIAGLPHNDRPTSCMARGYVNEFPDALDAQAVNAEYGR
jgi:hypothetical protein